MSKGFRLSFSTSVRNGAETPSMSAIFLMVIFFSILFLLIKSPKFAYVVVFHLFISFVYTFVFLSFFFYSLAFMLVRFYANMSIQKISGIVNHQYLNISFFNANTDMVIVSRMSEKYDYSLKDALLQPLLMRIPDFSVIGCTHCCQTEPHKNLSSYELWLLLE